MEAKIIEGYSTLDINGRRITFSHGPQHCEVIDDSVVALLRGWSDPDVEFWEKLGVDMSNKTGDADFELVNSCRNVVAFNSGGDHIWTIPEVPDEPTEQGIEPYYLGLWTTDGELWVRNKNQMNYRLDPESGEILESVPASHLRLGGRTIEFDHGWVKKVVHLDDSIAVILSMAGHPDPDGRNLYVFDTDGTERWWIGDRLDDEASPEAPPFTNVWVEEGELRAYATDGYEYRFDPADGALLGQEWLK